MSSYIFLPASWNLMGSKLIFQLDDFFRSPDILISRSLSASELLTNIPWILLYQNPIVNCPIRLPWILTGTSDGRIQHCGSGVEAARRGHVRAGEKQCHYERLFAQGNAWGQGVCKKGMPHEWWVTYRKNPERKHIVFRERSSRIKYFCDFSRDFCRTSPITNRSIPFITWNLTYLLCKGDFIQFIQEGGPGWHIVFRMSLVAYFFTVFFICRSTVTSLVM